MADETRSFDSTPVPTSAEVSHELQQGLGVGQRELDAQREPRIDPPLLDEIEEELDEPASHGKASPAETQGAKTRAATKDQISRR
jgi:hypothetical protein